MLAGLLLNLVAAYPSGAPPPKPRPAITVKYIWPPPGYELKIEQEIERQEETPHKPPVKARARAVKAVDRRLAQALARQEEMRVGDAQELIRRHKAEFLAQMARKAIEDDDEDALAFIFLMMDV